MKQHKRWVSWMLVLAMLLGGTAIPASAETAENFPEQIAAEFADPSAEYRAGFRYELPGGQVDQAQVKAEMQAIKDAGFAVVEITASGVSDYTQYGLDSAAWRTTLKTIYSTCNELGLQADIHLSFNNGANLYVPGLEVTDAGVSKDIVEAHAALTGGIALPAGTAVPVMGSAGTQDNASRKLVRTYLAKVNEVRNIPQISPPVTTTNYDIDNLPTTDVSFLDEDSLTDITNRVRYDAESNTASLTEAVVPGAEGERWVLIAVYEQGLAATSKVGTEPARKMDYFSEAGTRAFTDFYDTQVFDDELRAMMRQNGGDLFSDSYGANCTWTDGFLDIFKDAMGYDIGEYLPILFTDVFDFDGDLGTRVRNDHKDVLTELYCKYHLEGLTQWANSLGLQYRDQVVYSALRDMMTAAMYVDVPETESLYFMDEIDNYLAMSAPANLARKSMVSTELGALRGRVGEAYAVGGYSQTWEDIIIQANRSFAGGVNQMLLHTFPYQSSTTHSWPGYTAFGFIFSENWGPRLPAWQDARDVGDYLARAQYIMRKGISQRDVVIYKHNYDWARWSGEYVTDQTLTREGYTFDFINPAMMQHENAYAENGVIDPEGGSYRALIIDSEQYPFMHYFARPASDMMPLDAALKIEEYAKAGVPIIIVGEAPSRAESMTEADSDIAAVFTRMTQAGQITYVDSEADIAGVLHQLEIRPAADNNTPCGVTTYLRTEDGVNYYFLYNQGDFDSIQANPYTGGEADCDQTISLRGEGRPYLLDLWTGEVTPIAQYTTGDGYVNVPVELAINESCIIAVGGSDSGFHAVKADSGVFYDEAGNLVLRANRSGSYQVTLANGTRRTVDIAAVAAPVTPESWTLSVESWTPANEFGTKGAAGAATAKTRLPDIQLTELKPWNAIAELGDAISGIGAYTTEFYVDGPADGAILSLGQVFDTVSVKVNGQDVTGINQSTGVIDLGGLVQAGKNTLEIQSVSTLRNAVRKVDPSYASKTVHEYGLLGPVTVTPYVTASVADSKQPVTLRLSGPAEAALDTDGLTYTLSADNADRLATATVTVSYSSNLEAPAAEGLNGWYVISAAAQDGRLTVVLGHGAGLTGSGELLKLTAATPDSVGSAAVKLEQAVLSVYDQDSEAFVGVNYGETTVETRIDYSLYDVNQDGTVNQLDITRAQRAYGASAGDASWNARADVNRDGVVDIADLIPILNHYSK